MGRPTTTDPARERKRPLLAGDTGRQIRISGRRHFLPFLLASVLFTAGCATFPGSSEGSGASKTPFEHQIDAILDAPPLDQVNWGVLIVDPEDGQVLYDRNARRKFIPASNMKLLATSTALTLLGPAYRYETEIWGVGVLSEGDGTLEGDLILRATGDPTLSERFYPSGEAPLDSLAEGLWAAGIRTVSGSLVVDASPWDSTTVPGSWMVANLPGTSGATGGIFAIGEGALSVEVTGGDNQGAPAQARWWPSTDEGMVSVDYLTVHPDSSTRGRRNDYLPESRQLMLTGRIRAGEVDTMRVSQRNPVRLASGALLRALERHGIQVKGGLRIAWEVGETVGPWRCTSGPTLRVGESAAGGEGPRRSAPPRIPHCFRGELLTTLESPPLSEIVAAILKPSQNWMTEQLVRTLGMELGSRGSWGVGFQVEEEFFTHEVGLDSLDLFYRDGSGMSAQDLVTPQALVRILDYMRRSPNGEAYLNALATPGEDGTLRSRLPELRGRVFGKTGTLTHVTSLSGYLIADDGRELIFSILSNGSGISSGIVRRGMDRVVETMASQVPKRR